MPYLSQVLPDFVINATSQTTPIYIALKALEGIGVLKEESRAVPSRMRVSAYEMRYVRTESGYTFASKKVEIDRATANDLIKKLEQADIVVDRPSLKVPSCEFFMIPNIDIMQGNDDAVVVNIK
jgi:hypothetical protein